VEGILFIRPVTYTFSQNNIRVAKRIKSRRARRRRMARSGRGDKLPIEFESRNLKKQTTWLA
jgi:hypothetical protein